MALGCFRPPVKWALKDSALICSPMSPGFIFCCSVCLGYNCTYPLYQRLLRLNKMQFILSLVITSLQILCPLFAIKAIVFSQFKWIKIPNLLMEIKLVSQQFLSQSKSQASVSRKKCIWRAHTSLYKCYLPTVHWW